MGLPLIPLPNPLLLLPVLLQLHNHLPNVCGYQRDLHTLKRVVAPGKVMYQDFMAVTDQFIVHKGSGGFSHGKGRWLVVPTLPYEGNSEPVDNWSEINIVSGVNNDNFQEAT